MRVRNKPWANERMAEYDNYVVAEPTKWRGNWQARFSKEQPLHIEVGSGKGRFITEMARLHPEINYIGIDMQPSVLVMALDKQIELQLPNLQLLHVDGRNLTEYFAEGEVDRVYLNFSDPWPKKKHAKKRLTYPSFLASYQTILTDRGDIHFKTDNQGLFEYTLVSFSEFGLQLKGVWLDLHQSEFEGNVMTEYEEKFSKRGQRIYRLEAFYPPARRVDIEK